MLYRLKILYVVLGLQIAPATLWAQQHPVQPMVLPYVVGPHGVIQIHVRLNDQTSGIFAVDTGAMTSVLNDQISRKLRLKSDPDLHKQPGADPDLPADLHMVTLAHFQCGLLSVRNLQLRSVSGQTLEGISGRELAGLLGADILSRFAVLFDFQKHQILLWKGGHLSTAQRATVGMRDAQSVALTQPEDYQAPAGLRDAPKQWYNTVPISLNGAPTRQFTVDTGSDVTLVPTDLAHQQGLHAFKTEQYQIGFDDGPMDIEVAVADFLSLGSFHVRHPVVDYATHESDTDAIVGRDVLTQLYLLLDYPAAKAYFKPLERQAVSLPFAAPGLNIPLVTVRLKDGKPSLFGIEPAFVTSIDGGVAAARHLLVPATPPRGDVSIVSPLWLGNNALCLDSVIVQVTDFTALRASEVYPEDGRLGADLLDQVALRLDFTQRTVEMISPGHLEGTHYLSARAQRLPLTKTEAGYAVDGQVDGVAARFIVGLTTSITTLSSHALVAGLHPVATLAEAGFSVPVHELRLHRIQVGNAIWNAPIVLDVSPVRESDLNLLGTDFLGRFHVVVDYAASALYLDPDPHNADTPTEISGLGFRLTTTGDRRMVINGLTIPSPASEAALQLGDEVVAVNSRVVWQTLPGQIITECKKPVGMEIILTIRSKGGEKTHEVKLKVRKLL
jgi:hypothetical protein